MDVIYLAGLVARWRRRSEPEAREKVVRVDDRIAVVPGLIVSVEAAPFGRAVADAEPRWVVQIVTVLGQRVNVTYGPRDEILRAYERILEAIETRGPLDAHR